MKLSTGKVAFPIEFDTGDKEFIYFNPNNPDFFIKMNYLQEKVNERIKEIEDIELDENGKPKDLKAVEQFEKIQKIVCEELDYAFDSKISDVVFKHCSPLGVVDGQYQILLFIEGIMPDIKKELEKSNKQVSENMRKYIDKYKK